MRSFLLVENGLFLLVFLEIVYRFSAEIYFSPRDAPIEVQRC